MNKFSILYKLKNKTPFKKNDKKEIYEIDNFIVKVFIYKNFISKLLSLKGLRGYIAYIILKKKQINIPEVILYFSEKNKEYFVYKKIEGEDLLQKFKKENKKEILLKKLEDFIIFLFEKGIYHKDFDPTNIIVDSEGNFNLIDLENVSFFLTKNRKIKMIKKINKFLKVYFNIEIS